MDKYNQLKSFIQAANPETMELKFGCEIDNDSGFIEKIVADVGDGSYLMLDADNQPFRYHGILLKKHIKGRPIRLADVLLAMWKAKKWFSVDWMGQFRKQAEDEFSKEWEIYDGHKYYPEWNLFDDNLDHQSEETKQSLINLLVHE